MRRFFTDDGGNMALLFAAAFSLSGVVGAIAVDAAALHHERRMIQAAVDLAALTAVVDPAEADEIARAVLAEAGFPTQTGLRVITGHFVADALLASEDRFTPGVTPANAVEVRYERPGTLYFAAGFADPPILGASGLATIAPEVSFSIGSRLASLNGGIANALLSTLLGTSVNLSVADYNRLAAVRVDALRFLDALAFELDLKAGSYDDLLDASASAGQIARALSRLVDGSEKALLVTLGQGSSGHRVALGKLFDFGRYGRLIPQSGAEAVIGIDLSVLEILSATAALADGGRQVFIDFGKSIPGLAGLSVELVIGEPVQGGSWFAVGTAGTVLRTAQVRLRFEAQFLGGVVLQSAPVRLPLWLDLAHAEAQVVDATCPNEDHPYGTAQIAVSPGVLDLAIGQVTNSQLRAFGTPLPLVPVRILNAVLLHIDASAHVRVAQTGPILLDFSSSDIGNASLRKARTTTIVTSLGQSLLSGMVLDIKVLGLGLSPLNVLNQALRTLVAPLAAPLDLVVNTLLNALGLGIGEADVRVYGVRCTNPVLVR